VDAAKKDLNDPFVVVSNLIKLIFNTLSLEEVTELKNMHKGEQIQTFTPFKASNDTQNNQETPLTNKHCMNPNSLSQYTKRSLDDISASENESNEEDFATEAKRKAQKTSESSINDIMIEDSTSPTTAPKEKNKTNETNGLTAKENRRKRNKNMYKDLRNENTRKPKTIVYRLTENQVKTLKNTNLDQFVVTQTGAQVKGTKLTGNILSIFPHNQGDFEAIVTDKNWALCKNEFKTLENRDYVAILKFIGVDDINNDSKIQSQLLNLGIISWAPLIVDDPEYLSVKVVCKSKEFLKNILEKYYYEGLSIRTTRGEIIKAKVSPSVGRPKQCFKCFKYENHFADECTEKESICERCGAYGHMKKICASDPRCCNCNEQHSARSLDCSIYKEKKATLISEALFDITGVAMVRPQGKKHKEKYIEAVKVQKEGIQVSKNFNAWQHKADALVDDVATTLGATVQSEINKMQQVAENVRQDVDKNSNTLKEAVNLAKQALNSIDAKMPEIARKECQLLEKRIEKNLATLETGLDVAQVNINTVNNTLIDWRKAAAQKEKELEARIQHIEHFLGTRTLSNITNGIHTTSKFNNLGGTQTSQ
jgi:hypothetical protein